MPFSTNSLNAALSNLSLPENTQAVKNPQQKVFKNSNTVTFGFLSKNPKGNELNGNHFVIKKLVHAENASLEQLKKIRDQAVLIIEQEDGTTDIALPERFANLQNRTASLEIRDQNGRIQRLSREQFTIRVQTKEEMHQIALLIDALIQKALEALKSKKHSVETSSTQNTHKKSSTDSAPISKLAKERVKVRLEDGTKLNALLDKFIDTIARTYEEKELKKDQEDFRLRNDRRAEVIKKEKIQAGNLESLGYRQKAHV